ncbi:MAG: endonuclease III [Clostridia bacterium]|nr:endonuclease III [Clostridia bacterium]
MTDEKHVSMGSGCAEDCGGIHTGGCDGSPRGALTERLRWVNRGLEAMYGPKPLRPHGDPVGELVHTILTQNTSDVNSDRTYASLRDAFSSWEDVADAPAAVIADLIRVGGLAEIKSARIVEVLRRIREEQGSISLDMLGGIDDKEAFGYLTSLPGVGPKTAACVLLFALGRPVFPVDTHVHRVSNRLGLVHTKDLAETQAELARAMPADITYQLHMNMVTHGRRTCHARKPACDLCQVRPGCQAALDSGEGPLRSD